MQKSFLVNSGHQPALEHDNQQPGANPVNRPDFSVQNGDHSKRVSSVDPLLTAEQVAERLNVSKDWVWDHSSRKTPLLPVIRMGDGTLRYRASKIEEFINERERLSYLRRKRG